MPQISSVFINARHDLRSGWKFAVYVAIFLLLWVATAILLTGAARQTLPEGAAFTPFGELAANAIALFLPSVGALVFMARFVDHRRASTFGTGLHRGWPRHLLAGLGLAAVMVAALWAGSHLLGDVAMRWAAPPTASLLATVMVLAVSAANEELVFRGYPMQTLAEGIGPWPAAAVMSGLFALLHLSNPHASAPGIMNTVLAGLMLSAAYWKTRSLWLPYGVHLGWNIGIGVVLGFPLSGLEVVSFWRTAASGSEALLGSAYGPEDGALCTLVFLAGTVVVRAVRIRKNDDSIRENTRPGQ